ncbi:diacylglycerol kinase family protein [Sphingomonas sp. Leaf257]|jgi:diacylglycerol kinase (ATP)|uniref:diacylglycerol kinase family protein n=1 Tax=Sphingomonas sp. Leaf257 TaxID=1736309 RepID=UPI0006F54E7C|nr:diacylglycerol kinase family protein [Sphingomonas sp. Leaf257]KQO50253.1 diacylglycerol kinase [Sphingomonas sp. Leaf257]
MLNPHEPPCAPTGFNVRARLKSFVYAGRGLRWLVWDEHNAWLHFAASVIVIVLGFTLRISLEDWRWIVLAMALVWIAEAINTAIEDLCDHLNPDFDPAIGRVKDLAAGGVLIASMAAIVIGLLTFGPILLSRIIRE